MSRLLAVAVAAVVTTGGLKASGYPVEETFRSPDASGGQVEETFRSPDASGGQVEETFRSPVSVFTAKQATSGKAVYVKECASCHMPDLSGENEMPALAGAPFKAMWGTRTTKELFDYMSEAMPYGRPSLSAEEYTSILAYILQSNGAVAGERELSASTVAEISSLTPLRAR